MIDREKTEAEGFMVTPFVAALMEKSATETAWATNQVLDAAERKAKRAQATLDLVRERISKLIKGPWMPTTDALRNALWPFDEEIEARMAGGDDAA
jgi:hypothetical protein